MATFSGIVQKGNRRGTELGFPTLNIPLGDSDISGVYAARVKLGDEWYEAAVFADKKRRVLEAHILDFSAELYGWQVTVELLEKIRESKKFRTDAVLKESITQDLIAVRSYFKRR